MRISYAVIIGWLTKNYKVLILSELLCFLCAGIYLLSAPRIYEVNFAISIPKVLKLTGPNSKETYLGVIFLGRDYIRSMQSPLAYPTELVAQCMGEDTNQNRKLLVNANEMSLAGQSDIIRFSLRLPGQDITRQCALLIQELTLSNLNRALEKLRQEVPALNQDVMPLPDSQGLVAQTKPFIESAIVTPLRMSDSYVKPQRLKICYAAFFAGIFLALGFVGLRGQYRA